MKGSSPVSISWKATETEVLNDETRTVIAPNNLGVYYCLCGQFDEAIKHFEVCLNISKEIGDRIWERRALHGLAFCYRFLHQYDKTIDCLEALLTISEGNKQDEMVVYRSLSACYDLLGLCEKAMECSEKHLIIAQDLGHESEQMEAYTNLGFLSLKLCSHNRAIGYLESGIKMAKETGNKAHELSTYGILGAVYVSQRHYEKAIKPLEAFLSHSQDIKDKQGEKEAILSLGNCYCCLSQYHKASEYLEIGLQLARNLGDKEGEGQACFALGKCYTSVYLYEKAITYLEAGLSIAKETGNRTCQWTSYDSIGTWHSDLGQYGKAIEYLKIGLAVAKKSGNKEGECRAYYRLGVCNMYLNNYNKAMPYLKRNLAIAKKIGHKKCEGRAYGSLGTFYTYLGKTERALEFHKIHIAIAKEIGDKHGEMTAQTGLAVNYLFIGQYEKAIAHLEVGLAIAKETKDLIEEGRAYEALGVCYMSIEQYDRAENRIREAVNCYERLFENAPTIDEYQISVFGIFEDTYKLLVETLLGKTDVCEALVVAEKGRSRALVKLILNGSTAESLARTPVHISDLNDICEVASALGSTVVFFAIRLCQIYMWVINNDGDITFNLYDGSQLAPRQPKDLVSLKEYLISLINAIVRLMSSCGPVVCEDRSLSFLYSEASKPDANRRGPPPATCDTDLDNSTVAGITDGPEPELNDVAGSSVVPVQDPGTKQSIVYESKVVILDSLLRDLYQILLAPVRQSVLSSQAVIVPDGPLALVPYAALLDENGKYVCESLQVRLTPSLTVEKLIRERPQNSSGQNRPLIVGDPDIDYVLMDGKAIPVPKLKWAKKEIDMISTWLDAELLSGKRATKEEFLRRAEHANLIHIAAHGHADKGEILLAPNPSATNRVPHLKDILLTISDLERRRINAKLVVLSCCHSGRGDVTADGVIGMGRAFLGAGARAVLVTLWAVNDRTTMCFMHRFYDHLLHGMSANEALDKSMKTIKDLKEFSHPRYWAPFVLLGEDVTFTDLKKPRHETAHA